MTSKLRTFTVQLRRCQLDLHQLCDGHSGERLRCSCRCHVGDPNPTPCRCQHHPATHTYTRDGDLGACGGDGCKCDHYEAKDGE